MKFDADIVITEVCGGEKSVHKGYAELFGGGEKDGGRIEFEGGVITFGNDFAAIKKPEYVLDLRAGDTNDFCVSLPQGALKGQVFCLSLNISTSINELKIIIKTEYDLLFEGFTQKHKVIIKAEKA